MADKNQKTFAGFNDVSIRADVYGDNHERPVLFAHGGGQTRHAWRQTGRLLAEQGCQSFCIDLRGHGESDWSKGGDYGIDMFAEDLLCICDQLEFPPVLVGASLGGNAAMVAAGDLRPGVFSALIFVDVTPHLEPTGVDKIVGFMGEHLAEGFGSLEEAADVIADYLPNRPKRKNLSGLEKNLRKGDDGRYRWHWDPQFIKGLYSPTTVRDPLWLSHAVEKIDVPILLVRGQMSELVSEESVRQFLELRPDAKFVDVAKAGHMVAGDHNDAFTAAIADFLSHDLGWK